MNAAAPEEVLLLSVEQTARALNCSTRLVEGLLARGELASVKIGRLRRIPRAAVTAFISRLEGEQAEEQLPPEALRVLHRTGRGSR